MRSGTFYSISLEDAALPRRGPVRHPLGYYARVSSSGAKISKDRRRGGEVLGRWGARRRTKGETREQHARLLHPHSSQKTLPLSSFSPPLLTSFLGFRAEPGLFTRTCKVFRAADLDPLGDEPGLVLRRFVVTKLLSPALSPLDSDVAVDFPDGCSRRGRRA